MGTLVYGNIVGEAYNTQAKAINVIQETENELVNGNVYDISNFFSLGDGATRTIGLTTSNAIDLRLVSIYIKSDVNYVKLEIFEDISFTGDAILTPNNRNRQHADNALAIFYGTFTVAPDLTGKTPLITYSTVGGKTVPAASIGGSSSDPIFWVAKRDTNYVLRYTNVSVDIGTVEVHGMFIETDLTD